MTYTLLQVRDILRAAPDHGGNVHLRPGDCADLADAIDANLSQPQPVAQGEAVGEFYVKCVRCHGEGMADIYVGSTGGSFNQPPDPVFERDACPECEGACFVPATPTIPTGYRVVPDALSDDAVIFGDDDDDGYRMGWNACRKAMLVAAPDAGGV